MKYVSSYYTEFQNFKGKGISFTFSYETELSYISNSNW